MKSLSAWELMSEQYRESVIVAKRSHEPVAIAYINERAATV